MIKELIGGAQLKGTLSVYKPCVLARTEGQSQASESSSASPDQYSARREEGGVPSRWSSSLASLGATATDQISTVVADFQPPNPWSCWWPSFCGWKKSRTLSGSPAGVGFTFQYPNISMEGEEVGGDLTPRFPLPSGKSMCGLRNMALGRVLWGGSWEDLSFSF